MVLLLPMLVSCEEWRLERAGQSKCEEGLALVRRAVETFERSPLSDADRGEALGDLERGRVLLRDGMAAFAKANEKTGKNYDVMPYLEALKAARLKLAELQD